jgi:pimeloyl-ACP methyl ester carboxylesterase
MSAGERLPGTPTPMHTWSGAGGLTIAGDTWGDPNGPLVVLQHGGGQTRHAWKGAGETLGNAGYHAVAFDARGHGDSGWAPADEYGQDYMIKDLICVVEALGGKRPILVGASMGGGVSLIAIGESHLEASALVLVDMAPQMEAEGARRIQAFMNQKPEGFDTLQEVADAIANYQLQVACACERSALDRRIHHRYGSSHADHGSEKNSYFSCHMSGVCL